MNDDTVWYERDLWVLTGPSRRLRKLYRQLDALDAEIDAARERIYCADHAPTDCRWRRRVVNDLLDQRFDLWNRINRLQNG